MRYGIGIDEHDHEGRAITLEYPDFFLVCAYVPNSQDGLRRLDYRMRWEDDMRAYLGALPKPVILCGDLNVAHEEIDLKNPASNRRNAGFTDEERAKFSALLAAGYIDTWRFQHPGEVKYSWWSYRFNARANNAGWRIDYFVVSEALRPRILTTAIHDEITGSDHCWSSERDTISEKEGKMPMVVQCMDHHRQLKGAISPCQTLSSRSTTF